MTLHWCYYRCKGRILARFLFHPSKTGTRVARPIHSTRGASWGLIDLGALYIQVHSCPWSCVLLKENKGWAVTQGGSTVCQGVANMEHGLSLSVPGLWVALALDRATFYSSTTTPEHLFPLQGNKTGCSEQQKPFKKWVYTWNDPNSLCLWQGCVCLHLYSCFGQVCFF